MPQNVISTRRGVLAAAVAACALAGSMAAAGPATAAVSESSPSFGCGTEQSPTSAYTTWQKNLIDNSSSAKQGAATASVKPLAAASSQPDWLASFDSMTTDSQTKHDPQDDGLNWFTWDHPTGAAYVRQAFATPSSYIMEAKQGQVSTSGDESGWPAKPTIVQAYKSAWDLISALDPAAFSSKAGFTGCDTALDSDAGAVLYDDEDWAGTPTIEQKYPGYYVAMIAYYVHRYNIAHPAHPLKFFVAPAISLSNTVIPTHGKGAWNYLADDIPELVSTPSTTWHPDQSGTAGTDGNFGSYAADDVDIQAQQDEPVVTGTVTSTHVTYQYLVRRAADQIAVGDPDATLFAGLTTNNTGGTGNPATVAMLQTAASKVQGIVSGFWLNDPPHSATTCPSCTGTYPNIADRSLNAIDTSPTW